MAAQLAFTASPWPNGAILACAVVGLPGLALDEQQRNFPTWTQANAYALKLNEGLGLTPLESRILVNDVRLAAAGLIRECDSLRRQSKQLKQLLNQDLRLGFLLAELDLGITFCRMACDITSEDVKKRRLRKARKALSDAVLSMGRFAFTSAGSAEIRSRIERLQNALPDCAPPERPVFQYRRTGLF
jgi:hypothetical protein